MHPSSQKINPTDGALIQASKRDVNGFRSMLLRNQTASFLKLSLYSRIIGGDTRHTDCPNTCSSVHGNPFIVRQSSNIIARIGAMPHFTDRPNCSSF